MSRWTNDELDKIGGADELRIAARREDNSLRQPTPIWVVRVGDDLFVRSYKGASAAWYRGAQERREGRIWSGGLEKDVNFVDAAAELSSQIDAAYRAKYSRYGASYINMMLSPQAQAATIRLTPRPAA